MPINILEIPQNADSLGRTLDNLGKDFRTSASRAFGVGDSAEVYAVSSVISQQLAFINKNGDYGRMGFEVKYDEGKLGSTFIKSAAEQQDCSGERVWN